MSDQELVNRDEGTNSYPAGESIGDSSHPETMDTDLNGASTAVGVPHPENRGGKAGNGGSENAKPIDVPELDDYDEVPADDQSA